jgi:RNA polymerase sigma-70 factor (ECF subfamily)
LWRITRNAFLDGVRKKKRRPTSPLPEGDNSALGASPSPDEVLASVRLSDDVQAALLKLPYDFREAVVLCDVVGLTYEEIADAVDIPVGTVRSRIHRGRTMLRGLLTWPV